MMKFREWLHEAAANGKSKIAIFDFDGTLANSPMKPETPEAKARIGWNGKDWWGSDVSLPPTTTLNSEVVEAFKRAKSDPDTYTALITGRRGIVAQNVRGILQRNDLIGARRIGDNNANAKRHHAGQEHPNEKIDSACHDEYFCGDFVTEPDYPKTGKGKADSSTLAHKKYVIEKLMHPGVIQLDFWDDRADHIPHFIKLGMDLQRQWPNLKSVAMHRVYAPEHPGQPAWVQHIPIKIK